jgi:hypothetical protein
VLVQVRQRSEEGAGVVVAEAVRDRPSPSAPCAVQSGGAAGLTGDLAQLGCVLAGPRGDRPVAGAFVTGGLDALLAGEVGVAGRPEPEVAPFSRLPAGHAEDRCQACPGSPTCPSGFDEQWLAGQQSFAQLVQGRQGVDCIVCGVAALGTGGAGAAGRGRTAYRLDNPVEGLVHLAVHAVIVTMTKTLVNGMTTC